MKTVTDNAYQTFTGETWRSLAGSSNYVTVPSGATRVARATFDAESSCTGSVGGCQVKIVARKSGTSTLVEFYPRLGTMYFDSASAGDDRFESHAMTRSKTLAAGTWQIFVQATTTNPSDTKLFLSGWTHSVDLYAK